MRSIHNGRITKIGLMKLVKRNIGSLKEEIKHSLNQKKYVRYNEDLKVNMKI